MNFKNVGLDLDFDDIIKTSSSNHNTLLLSLISVFHQNREKNAKNSK